MINKEILDGLEKLLETNKATVRIRSQVEVLEALKFDVDTKDKVLTTEQVDALYALQDQQKQLVELNEFCLKRLVERVEGLKHRAKEFDETLKQMLINVAYRGLK
jgi:hypothetical protein